MSFLPPETDEAGTRSRDAGFAAPEVVAAVGTVPFQAAVFTVPAGARTLPDRHPGVQELWLVQQGHGHVHCAGLARPAGPGTLIALAGDETHQLVAGAEDMTVLSLWWRT
ncbi:hypothetical protein GCM10010218_32540 [Streptomyces mashuensis]|uniref:Cupin 2 conserved barrel domain-containing protein n=1 Tax=Streptomyces mashuensis TaxID=33904 RepID=A0A919B3Z8_9ACTN|nr:hypothetical protein GCM10010218_32540 [Streptomyces mashuensis]